MLDRLCCLPVVNTNRLSLRLIARGFSPTLVFLLWNNWLRIFKVDQLIFMNINDKDFIPIIQSPQQSRFFSVTAIGTLSKLNALLALVPDHFQRQFRFGFELTE
jgi:hypothetical protein